VNLRALRDEKKFTTKKRRSTKGKNRIKKRTKIFVVLRGLRGEKSLATRDFWGRFYFCKGRFFAGYFVEGVLRGW
jgi:hypothetical protein